MKKRIFKAVITVSLAAVTFVSMTSKIYAADSVIWGSDENSYLVTREAKATREANYTDGSNVNVILEGRNVCRNEAKLINNTTYVALRGFLNAVDTFDITWSQKSKTATARSSAYHIKAQIDECELIVNNNHITTIAENKLIDNKTYVPLRALAEGMGFAVDWNGSTKTVNLYMKSDENVNPDESYGTYGSYTARSDAHYDYEDLYWLSRIISAESRGESIEGKLAVGTVVMNRVVSGAYPDSIKGVVFDDKYAVQFTPTKNGTIYYEPTEESIFAAKIILEGYRMNNEIIYFVDTKVSPGSWVELNRIFVFKIGCHSFFK